MATRQELNVNPGEIRPVAAPTGLSGLGRIAAAVDPGEAVVAAFQGAVPDFNNALKKRAAEVEEDRFAEANQIAQTPEGVELITKLISAGNNEEEQKRIWKVASEQSLFPRDLVPYVKIAFAQGEAMRAGEILGERLNQRININQETVTTYDDDNQAHPPGKSFDEVVAEELKQFKDNRFLRTEIGNSVWSSQVTQLRQQYSREAITQNNRASHRRAVSLFKGELGKLFHSMSAMDTSDEMDTRNGEKLDFTMNELGRLAQLQDSKESFNQQLLAHVQTYGPADPEGSKKLLDDLSTHALGDQGLYGDGSRQPQLAAAIAQARTFLTEDNTLANRDRLKAANTATSARNFVWEFGSKYDTEASALDAFRESQKGNAGYVEGSARDSINSAWEASRSNSLVTDGVDAAAARAELKGATNAKELDEAFSGMFNGRDLSTDDIASLVATKNKRKELFEVIDDSGSFKVVRNSATSALLQAQRDIQAGKLSGIAADNLLISLEDFSDISPEELMTDGEIDPVKVRSVLKEVRTLVNEAEVTNLNSVKEFTAFLRDNPKSPAEASEIGTSEYGLSVQQALSAGDSLRKEGLAVENKVLLLNRSGADIMKTMGFDENINEIEIAEFTTGLLKINQQFRDDMAGGMLEGSAVTKAKQAQFDLAVAEEITGIRVEGGLGPVWSSIYSKGRTPDTYKNVPTAYRSTIFSKGPESSQASAILLMYGILSDKESLLSLEDRNHLIRIAENGLTLEVRPFTPIISKVPETDTILSGTFSPDALEDHLPGDMSAFIASVGGFTLGDFVKGSVTVGSGRPNHNAQHRELISIGVGFPPMKRVEWDTVLDEPPIVSPGQRRFGTGGAATMKLRLKDHYPLHIPLGFTSRLQLKNAIVKHKAFLLKWGKESGSLVLNDEEFLNEFYNRQSAFIRK